MASVHKKCLICVLYKDIAKSSDCLMSNLCWMSDELMGGRKYNGYFISFGFKPEVGGFDSQWVHWNVSFT